MADGRADTSSPPPAPYDITIPTTIPTPGLPVPADESDALASPDEARSLWERTGLQVAHRCGAAAMLVYFGAVAAAVTRREYGSLLLAAFVLADVALAGALLAWRLARAGNRSTREAFAAAVFSTLWLAPSFIWLAIRQFARE